MKSALIAIDPMSLQGSSFEGLCEMVRFFQKKGFFSRTSIVSVLHASQFLTPYSYYRDHKDELAREAWNNINGACSGKFQFVGARVLQSDSHANEEIINLISKHGRRMNSDLLVIGSNERRGLPYWFLGSLSETASLMAKMPVLVVKGATSPEDLARSASFAVGVDVAAPPSPQDINWIVSLAKTTRARVHLLYVTPQRRPVVDRLQQRKSRAEATRTLERIQRAFETMGIHATTSIREETRSISHVIVEFAEKKGALLTIVTTAKRSRARKLLLGSTARRVLALTKRPFLSLRLD